jgi:hypothetical protein
MSQLFPSPAAREKVPKADEGLLLAGPHPTLSRKRESGKPDPVAAPIEVRGGRIESAEVVRVHADNLYLRFTRVRQ